MNPDTAIVAEHVQREWVVLTQSTVPLSAELSAEIKQRVAELTQPLSTTPPAAAAQAVSTITLPPLVQRPGITPRPLDSFFFEVVPKPAEQL